MKTVLTSIFALMMQQVFAQNDTLPPSDTLAKINSSRYICGQAQAELPNDFISTKNQNQNLDWDIQLLEAKKIRLKLLDRWGREVYKLDLTPNYLPTEQNSQQQRVKTYPTGLAQAVRDLNLKPEIYFYLLEIGDFDNKNCTKTGKVELKNE